MKAIARELIIAGDKEPQLYAVIPKLNAGDKVTFFGKEYTVTADHDEIPFWVTVETPNGSLQKSLKVGALEYEWEMVAPISRGATWVNDRRHIEGKTIHDGLAFVVKCPTCNNYH